MTQRRDEIVNKAFLQFLNRGYHACSLKELEQRTELTKGAFYYYFKNKEEILKEGLERYSLVIEDLPEEEFERITTLREYIGVIMEQKARRAEKLYDLFGTFVIEEFYFQLVLEIEAYLPLYRKKLDELLRLRLIRWEQIILKAKQSGEIRESLDTSVLARNLMSVSNSMTNIELIGTDLRYALSDIRMQFEQYYMLIKNNGEHEKRNH